MHALLLPLAVSLPDNPNLWDNLRFQTTGILVVFFALGSLALVVALSGRLFVALEKRQAAAKAVPSPDLRAAPPGEGVPPEISAVIAAAVAVALAGRPFAVRRVHLVQASEQLRAWSVEGRRQIYASHKVR